MSREWDGKEVRGKIVAGEFVEAGDDQGRPPGTYVTIRFDDPSEGLVAGPVKVTYLPLQNEAREQGSQN